MTVTYGVVGENDAPASVIHAGLSDTPEDATFNVPWVRGLDGLEKVYDWLLDYEVPFRLYHDDCDTPPKVLLKSAREVVSVQNCVAEVISDSETILALYGPEFVLEINDDKTWLDLTNGLVPIHKKPELQDVEAEPLELTDEDVQGMPLAALKRVAKNQGIPVDGLKRDEIITALLSVPNGETKAVLADKVYPPVISVIVSQDGTAWGVDPDGRPMSLATLKSADVQQIFTWAGATRHEPF